MLPGMCLTQSDRVSSSSPSTTVWSWFDPITLLQLRILVHDVYWSPLGQSVVARCWQIADYHPQWLLLPTTTVFTVHWFPGNHNRTHNWRVWHSTVSAQDYHSSSRWRERDEDWHVLCVQAQGKAPSSHFPSERKSSNTRRRYCAHAGSTINGLFHLCTQTHTLHINHGWGWDEGTSEWLSDHCQGLLYQYVTLRRIPLKSGRLRLLGRNHRWHQQDLLEHPLNRNILLIWHRVFVECVAHHPHMSWKSFPAQLWHSTRRDSQRLAGMK